MSIYIYGVDLPQHGFINLTVFANGHVVGPDDGFNSFDTVAGRAIPVPEHGRLIDADAAVANRNVETNWCYDLCDLPDYLAGCPTIIPADKEVEE